MAVENIFRTAINYQTSTNSVAAGLYISGEHCRRSTPKRLYYLASFLMTEVFLFQLASRCNMLACVCIDPRVPGIGYIRCKDAR